MTKIYILLQVIMIVIVGRLHLQLSVESYQNEPKFWLCYGWRNGEIISIPATSPTHLSYLPRNNKLAMLSEVTVTHGADVALQVLVAYST
jgi:hypothetical protein